MTNLDAAQWILIIILGGLAGALGQSTRVVIGLKKLDDQAAAEGKTREDLFKSSRIMISLVIGFTAGALAALLARIDPKSIQVEQLLAFAAAGYTGADFIEGVMNRITPSTASPGAVRPAALPQPQHVSQDDYLG